MRLLSRSKSIWGWAAADFSTASQSWAKVLSCSPRRAPKRSPSLSRIAARSSKVASSPSRIEASRTFLLPSDSPASLVTKTPGTRNKPSRWGGAESMRAVRLETTSASCVTTSSSRCSWTLLAGRSRVRERVILPRLNLFWVRDRNSGSRDSIPPGRRHRISRPRELTLFVSQTQLTPSLSPSARANPVILERLT